MPGPAAKKRKTNGGSSTGPSTAASSPGPSPAAAPKPSAPLSALAARRAALAASASVTPAPRSPPPFVVEAAPSPAASESSSASSTSSGEPSSEEDELAMASLEIQPDASQRDQGKGRTTRYWDEGLPQMQTKSKQPVFERTERGWSPSGPSSMFGASGFEQFQPESEEEPEERSDSGERWVPPSHSAQRLRSPPRLEIASGSGTPGRGARRREEKRVATIPIGAISSFLPRLGENVILLSTEDLRKAFNDVGDGEGGAIVSLSEDENLIFSGLCRLYPLSAPVSLLSAILRPASSPLAYPVYAPTCHPLPVITPSSTSEGSHASTISPLVKSLSLDLETSSVSFLVRELDCGLDRMGKAVGGFDNVWKGDEAGWGVRGFHPILSQSSHRPHIVPPSWAAALASLPCLKTAPSVDDSSNDEDDDEEEVDAHDPLTALVKGPKRSGKSGFSRSLVNTLLGRYHSVAFLECDLGQNEFGPEGSVSLVIIEQPLLGPPFTHPAIPFRAHYYGAPTPRQDPSFYLAIIADLLETYRLRVQYPPNPATTDDGRSTSVVPLVINTQGWVKGLGMDLLRRIEAMAEINWEAEFDVLGGGAGVDVWEGRIPAEGGWGLLRSDEDPEELSPAAPSPAKRFQLEPIVDTVLSSRFTATDLRQLSLFSYLHARFPSSKSSLEASALVEVGASPLATRWDFSLPLVSQRPYTLDWSRAIAAVHLLGPGAEEIDASELPLVLNGALVGLLASDAPLPSPLKPNDNLPYVQGAPSPALASSELLGFAVVRSVASPSSSLRTMQILTPLPPSMLARVRTLIRGETELPVIGMIDWAATSAGTGSVEDRDEQLPYLVWGKEGEGGVVGGGRRRVRRNVGRRGGG